MTESHEKAVEDLQNQSALYEGLLSLNSDPAKPYSPNRSQRRATAKRIKREAKRRG